MGQEATGCIKSDHCNVVRAVARAGSFPSSSGEGRLFRFGHGSRRNGGFVVCRFEGRQHWSAALKLLQGFLLEFCGLLDAVLTLERIEFCRLACIEVDHVDFVSHERRRQKYEQVELLLLATLESEQPPQQRNVPQEGNLALTDGQIIAHESANDEGLAILGDGGRLHGAFGRRRADWDARGPGADRLRNSLGNGCDFLLDLQAD